jgi:phenylacetate-CoA ligase
VLHVIESAYFVEVIDPVNEKPVVPGQTGELVLTTLGRTGSPLLRYRTGDLVKCRMQNAECKMTACACGRFDLALEGGILGRTDDMVVVRGVNVYPSAVEEIIRASGEVAEYQVNVSTAHSLVELDVKVEPTADCGDVTALVRNLEKDFDKAFALRVPVTAVSSGTLPRFEMKAKRWVRS